MFSEKEARPWQDRFCRVSFDKVNVSSFSLAGSHYFDFACARSRSIMVAAALFPPAPLYQRHAHDLFLRLGLEVAGHKGYNRTTLNLRRFRSEYGVRPDACAEIWNDLLQYTTAVPSSLHPCHLFWFLKFVKQYPTEHQLAGQVHACEETVRFYVWFVGTAVRQLKNRKVSAST